MAQSEARQRVLDEARKAMEANREEVKKNNEEAMKRMDASQPTPTQEEIDLARVGIHVEQKQDDKSGENVVLQKELVAGQPLGPQGYETRSSRARRE